MVDKLHTSPLEVFVHTIIKVATNVEVDLGTTEDGDMIYGKQAYIGYLLDYDNDWILLGEMFEDGTTIPKIIVKKDLVVHVEEYNKDEEFKVNKSEESDTLN